MIRFFFTAIIIFIASKSITAQYTFFNKIVYNPTLLGYFSDTIDGGNDYKGSIYTNGNSICNLLNDTLIIRADLYGSENFYPLEIKITSKNFECDLWHSGCTGKSHYKTIKQTLIVDRKSFAVGDSISIEIYYKGVSNSFQPHGYDEAFVSEKSDTFIISGKIKLKIRDANFNTENLTIEKNYTKLLKQLNNNRPDTITEFSLYECGITSIPSELRKFKNIESLHLGWNNLDKVDFSMLSEFTNLKWLSLAGCNLSEIPVQIFNLKNLEVLELQANKLTSLPKELFQLTNLKELQLCWNHLTSLPIEILQLKKLEMLEFTGSKIEKLPPNFFSTLIKLKRFYPCDSLPKEEYKEFKPRR